jgi:hypothetical protein
MSNNPFIDHSAPAYQRYPDLSQPPQSPSWQQQQGYPQQQQSFQPQPTGYGGGYGMQQQQPMMTGAPSGFRPSSMFGQQLAAQLGPGGGQQQTPYGGAMAYQPTGYMGQQQPQQQQWGQQQQPYDWSAVAQFDPYASLGALNSAPADSGAGLFGAQPQPAHAPPQTSQSHSGELHPREAVQRYKRELEAWDPVAWKALTNAFGALRTAWDALGRAAQERVRGLGNMPNYDYGAAQEKARLDGVRPPCAADAAP